MNLERYLERIDPRQLRLLLSGGLLLVAALFLSLLWPQVKHYRALRQSHGILQQASTNRAELAQQLIAMRADIAQLRHRLHGDMVDLPLKQVETHVIGLLQRLCWRHHLELASVIPRPGETVHVFRETVLDVEVRGDYLDFFNWLQDMQDELGFLVVKQYEITPIEADRALPNLDVKIQIVAYRSVAP
jgi:Tfp pilus assembly protein PilO